MLGHMIPSNKPIEHDPKLQMKQRLYDGPFEVIDENLIGYFDGFIEKLPYWEYTNVIEDKYFQAPPIEISNSGSPL